MNSAHGLSGARAATVKAACRERLCILRSSERARHADRGAARDEYATVVRSGPGNDDSTGRLRPAIAIYRTRRTSCACSVGERYDQPHTERIVVLQSELDDMKPADVRPGDGAAVAAGALEVYSRRADEENRPGTLLTILARPSSAKSFRQSCFRETRPSAGALSRGAARTARARNRRRHTPLGTVRFKVARLGDTIVECGPRVRGLPAYRVGARRP